MQFICTDVHAGVNLGDSIEINDAMYASLKTLITFTIYDSISLKLSHFTRNLSRNNMYVNMFNPIQTGGGGEGGSAGADFERL